MTALRIQQGDCSRIPRFMPIYAARSLGIPMFDSQIILILCSILYFAFTLYAGLLSDRYGRQRILLPSILAYAFLCYPLFAYLIGNPGFYSLLIVHWMTRILLGFISGPFPATISELLPPQIRSSGVGIIYNIIGAIFGGLGPFLITSLIGLTGDKASPAYWALFTGVIGAIAVICLPFVTNRSIRKRTGEDVRMSNEPTA